MNPLERIWTSWTLNFTSANRKKFKWCVTTSWQHSKRRIHTCTLWLWWTRTIQTTWSCTSAERRKDCHAAMMIFCLTTSCIVRWLKNTPTRDILSWMLTAATNTMARRNFTRDLWRYLTLTQTHLKCQFKIWKQKSKNSWGLTPAIILTSKRIVLMQKTGDASDITTWKPQRKKLLKSGIPTSRNGFTHCKLVYMSEMQSIWAKSESRNCKN